MNYRIILTLGALAVLGSVAYAQTPRCKAPIEYGNRNQVDPKRSSLRTISGRVIAEAGRPAKQAGSVPACIGLFTEEGHRLVTSVVADDQGRFSLGSIRPGQYRLVVRDPQDVFCVANMPLSVVRWPRGKGRPLVIHLRPSGVDDCSYGDFN